VIGNREFYQMKVENQTTAPSETFQFDENRLVRQTRAGSFLGASEMVLPKGTKRTRAYPESNIRRLWWNICLQGVIPLVESSP